jgi:RNA ligase (TIGR02306 family)
VYGARPKLLREERNHCHQNREGDLLSRSPSLLIYSMEKSTHKVEVIEVKLEPHPNAEKLSIVRPFPGYTVCVQTELWKDGDLGAYIVPDSLIDSDRPEFDWLKGSERVKVKKLRGVPSMGLLVPAPPGSKLGDNVADQLGVKRYVSPVELATGGEATSPPPGYRPTYDIDSLRRYSNLFTEGEPVWITEKIHGSSARYCWIQGGEPNTGTMMCSSKNEWKKPAEGNIWWRALKACPQIETFCRANPLYTLYGEVYGQVQDLKYGAEKGQVFFAAFDIWMGDKWMPALEAKTLLDKFEVPRVPLLSPHYPFNFDQILKLAEGPSFVPGADHIREGVVVKPLEERTNVEIGRVQLKVVGNGYLEKPSVK